ncbi:MAG TPA: DnaJ domain-containing protein [Nitrospiria bacterium]|nr:DnaJ domain-containing protein [Nitrospiria bacterium]
MDKRKYVRFSRRLFVRFGSPVPRYIGYTEDLSREGLFIKSNVVFQSGTPLVIELKLSDSNTVNLLGIVKWAKAVSPSLFRQARKAGIAISLNQVPDSYAAFINSLEMAARRGSVKTPAAPVNGAEPGAPSTDTDRGRGAETIGQASEESTSQDHYQVLRVARTATPREIKRAYYAVAKLYHPDRHHHLSDPAAAERVKSLFCRINEAYRVLSSDDHRREYDLELSVRKLGLAKKEQAGRNGVEREAQLGRQALKAGQMTTAVYYLERAVEMRPEKSVFHDLLAQALSRLPQRKRDAERHFKKAIELEPARTEYYCHLGQFYREEGFPERALEQFEAARIWDPDDPDILCAVNSLKSK